MSSDSKRQWTIIVTRPGHTSSHYLLGPVRRTLLFVLALGTPLVTGVAGYLVGTDRGASVVAQASTSAAERVTSPSRLDPGRSAPGGAADRELGTAHGGPAAAAGEHPAGEHLAGEGPAGEGPVGMADDRERDRPGAAGAVDNGDGFELGPALSLQLDMGGSRVMRLHPFTADGRIIREAFTQLAEAMACEDGQQVSPSARLVQLLLATHERFDKPLLLVGGRCGAHDDEHGSETQHAVGRAVDLRMIGVSTGRLSQWLTEEQDVATAIGRYRKRGFVHVDVRPGERTTWEAGSSKATTTPQQAARPRRSAKASKRAASADSPEAPSTPGAASPRPTGSAPPDAAQEASPPGTTAAAGAAPGADGQAGSVPAPANPAASGASEKPAPASAAPAAVAPASAGPASAGPASRGSQVIKPDDGTP